MPTTPVNGQFGPDSFEVFSNSGVPVAAKYLKDAAGNNYIIDPVTNAPYVVPTIYNPAETAAYFGNLFQQVLDKASATGELVGSQPIIYPELYNAFKTGGWGDLQRPFADKTDVVSAFIPAASLNLGIGAAAGGVSALEAVIGGGVWNLLQNWDDPKVEKGWEFGNNPANPPHIRDGAEQFNSGALGPFSENTTTTSPDGQQTTISIDANGDGHTDIVSVETKQPDNSTTQDLKYFDHAGVLKEETLTAVNSGGTQ